MSVFDSLAEQSAKMAEQQREALKTNSVFLQKILNKEVKITEQNFSESYAKREYKGTVTDFYGEYIELDNYKLISTKWISSIEIL